MHPSPRLTSIRLSGSPSGVTWPSGVADVERRVRPGRLGEVLDRHRDPAVALDEEHVARLQHPPERRDVGVGEGLRARRRLGELAGEVAAQPIRQGVPRRRHRTLLPPHAAPPPPRAPRSILHPNGRAVTFLGAAAVSMLTRATLKNLSPRRVTMRRTAANGDRMGPPPGNPAESARREAARGAAPGGEPRGPARLRRLPARHHARGARDRPCARPRARAGRDRGHRAGDAARHPPEAPHLARGHGRPALALRHRALQGRRRLPRPRPAGARCRSRTSPRCCRPRPAPTRPSSATPSASSAASTRARRGSCGRSGSRGRASPRPRPPSDMTETAVRVALHRALKRLAQLRERMIE